MDTTAEPAHGEKATGEKATGDGRMRLHVTSHPVADPERRLARVLTPSQPLRNTYIYPSTYRIGEFRSNRADLLRLGALIRVAAASPHSAVHIPVPAGGAEHQNHMGGNISRPPSDFPMASWSAWTPASSARS